MTNPKSKFTDVGTTLEPTLTVVVPGAVSSKRQLSASRKSVTLLLVLSFQLLPPTKAELLTPVQIGKAPTFTTMSRNGALFCSVSERDGAANPKPGNPLPVSEP